MVLCKIYCLRKWRKKSSSDVVLYTYSFKTQIIGFEMIRVRGFKRKFHPKVFKGTNRATLKNMLVCHHPNLFFGVYSAGRIFFYHFEMEKIELILIYNIFETKNSFLGMNIKKNFDRHVSCRLGRVKANQHILKSGLVNFLY